MGRPTSGALPPRKMLPETALSCSAIYGTIPTTETTVTIPPSVALLPYRDEMKSASEVIRFSRQIRTILRSTSQQTPPTTVGPR